MKPKLVRDKSSWCILVLLVFFTATTNLEGQIPVIETPKQATFQIYGYDNMNPHANPAVPTPNSVRETNARILRETQQRNAEILKIFYEHSKRYSSIQYDLPSKFGTTGTEHYQNALEKLCKMLRGELPLSLKDAVFTVENAFFENKLDYSGFNRAINTLTQNAQLKTMQDGYNWKNPVTKNLMLFRILADTLEIKAPQRESSVISYPMQYDFDNYWGDNVPNMFVSKLLATGKGQCHSLPLLYLILCEETGAEAYLAYSPSHLFAKFKDGTGNWHNIELTNRHIVTDAFMVGSGFITAEAIKNRTYLEPQTKQQTIAQCLSDLTLCYARKYGYDSFVKQCVDSVLKYDANNLTALMEKANYETQRFEYVVNQVGRSHPDILKARFPKVYELLEERNRTYSKIDASGYREMSKEAYETWLNSVNDEKERREYQEKHHRVLQLIR